ncbi:MAG: hypothetical protein HZB51_13570 [Chloroflexi bacterium]|nr:hypothetical protein [Chloroflexota bacterium]
MNKLLARVFALLNQESIPYCVLRWVDELEQPDEGHDVDLLVQRREFARMRHALTDLGFVPLPAWGHAPHHFFVAYEEDSDCWIKLDIVTDIAFGRPAHVLYTPLADICLQNRCRHDLTFVLSPEEELVTLLLHCVVDEGGITPREGSRLKFLCDQVVDQQYVTLLLTTYYLPDMSFSKLAPLIQVADWETLLARRNETKGYLTRLDRLGTFFRQVGYPALRKLERVICFFRPQTFTVALLAPDGAGKSTLATNIEKSFLLPVRSIYMGLYPGRRNRIGSEVPGIHRRTGVPVLGLLGHLCTQWKRYFLARYHVACGRLVIFDRYTYDALLPPNQSMSRIKRWRRWLLAHACPAPEFILFLDAPGKLLYARKGEGSAAALEQQRQHYRALKLDFPQMIMVDATQSADQVRRQATSLIWNRYVRRLGPGGRKPRLMGGREG